MNLFVVLILVVVVVLTGILVIAEVYCARAERRKSDELVTPVKEEQTIRVQGLSPAYSVGTVRKIGWRKGKAMRKVAVIAFVVMVSVALVASVMAQSGIREDCVTLCKDAAKFINEKGLDAAIAEINNKEGKFVTKNTYVFLMDLEGNELAHPYHAMTGNPRSAVTASGRNVLKLFDWKDTTGKLVVQEYIKIAKTKGEGWMEYMYPKPEEQQKPTPYNEKIFSKKITYVYRVPDKDLMVIAGYFE